MTAIIEAGVRAAAGIAWQHLGAVASGADPAGDHFHPARAVVAEYLRRTGRHSEARDVDAVGCNEPAPTTGFGRRISEAELAAVRRAMRSTR